MFLLTFCYGLQRLGDSHSLYLDQEQQGHTSSCKKWVHGDQPGRFERAPGQWMVPVWPELSPAEALKPHCLDSDASPVTSELCHVNCCVDPFLCVT